MTCKFTRKCTTLGSAIGLSMYVLARRIDVYNAFQCGRFNGRQSDVVCQILTVVLYQLSVVHDFPFTLALSAVATVMDLAVRYNASTCIDGDHERLEASADAAIVAVEAFDSVAATTRPTIHRLTHVPGSVDWRGGAKEYDGGPYEHETPETRAAASSGNWRAEGSIFLFRRRILTVFKVWIWFSRRVYWSIYKSWHLCRLSVVVFPTNSSVCYECYQLIRRFSSSRRNASRCMLPLVVNIRVPAVTDSSSAYRISWVHLIQV